MMESWILIELRIWTWKQKYTKSIDIIVVLKRIFEKWSSVFMLISAPEGIKLLMASPVITHVNIYKVNSIINTFGKSD